MKKALLLCTSHNDLGLVQALRKLGYYIIATGNIENLPGQVWVDEWIKADYSDQQVILDIAKEKMIDNIVACCNDFGVYTAAYVAEKLGLPGYDSYETTLLLNNKDRFKKFALENDIQTPKSVGFTEEEEAHCVISKMELPLIVKPVDCSAGNGISVIKERDQADRAIKMAFEKSRARRIVVEPYITGSQHGFCTFLVNQKVVGYCSNNEYSFVNPFRVEIDTFPSDNSEECAPFLIEQIEKMAKILKLNDGIFHLQYIYQDGKPWIIEVMRRTLGNMYPVPGNRLTGIDWDYWEVRAKCGLECKDIPIIKEEGFFAYKSLHAKENGIIDNIFIPEDYKKYIYKQYMLLKAGDEITAYEKQPVGFLFMMFSDMEQMKKILIEDYRDDFVRISK